MALKTQQEAREGVIVNYSLHYIFIFSHISLLHDYFISLESILTFFKNYLFICYGLKMLIVISNK